MITITKVQRKTETILNMKVAVQKTLCSKGGSVQFPLLIAVVPR